jgi:transposase
MIMKLQYAVHLSAEEASQARQILRKGKHCAQVRNRAQVLLLRNKGLKDKEIAIATEMTVQAIQRIRKRYVKEGFEATIDEGKHTGRRESYQKKEEATVVALACSAPPEGAKRWTLALLKEHSGTEMSLSTIQLKLKKTRRNRGSKKCGASGKSMKNTGSECTI